ncbi:ABC transporter substrate-binding protein [Sporosarcina sp. FSL K6-2383]|uniref:ABC transporter substrate-binding protein n=1 Tax=Sporosarcina sp. FSL K6-2383 TaxID=2921556 RepID=UPI00315B32FD
MLKKKKISLLLVATFISILVLSGCSYSSEEPGDQGKGGSANSEYKNEIKIGLDVDAGTMDPRLANDSSGKRVNELVYDGLVRLSNSLEPQPSLAEEWSNPDATTWIFNLRKDVTFHDGEPFTAEDVKYTFDKVLDPEFQAPFLVLYEPIESIEVVDEHTVQFNLKQPYAPLLSYLDLGIVPKHIGEKDDNSLAGTPVGTGPYKMVKWDKNSKIAFEANESYWGGKSKTEKITYFIIPDNTTRVASLESGDIDLVHSPLSPQDIERVKGNDKFEVVEMEGLGYTYLNFNMQGEWTSDVKVRQAISHIINKEVISKDIYRSMDTPALSPLLPASWAYTEDVPVFEYNSEKSKELFNEAGWEDTDGDGFYDKDGKRFEITLSTHSEDPNRIQTVEYLQNEFEKNGVKVEVLTNEWPTFSANMMEGNFDIALLGWLNLFDPDRATYNQFYSGSGSNYGKYNNPKVDELLAAGRASLEQDERKEIYKEIAQIVTEEVGYNVLLYQGYVAMYNKNLEGFETYSNGSFYGLKDAVLTK